MKTSEELFKIIQDNERFLPSESIADIITLNTVDDEVVVAVEVKMASPKVNEEGEILDSCHRKIRYALWLKFKFSDLFMMPSVGQPVIRDISYTMKKLDEAQSKIAQMQKILDDLPEAREAFNAVSKSLENLPILGAHLAGQCSHATGKHDEECDLVAGLRAELKEARSEMFDLYHRRHIVCIVV